MALSIQKQTFQCTSRPCSFTTRRGYTRHELAQKRHEESAFLTPKQPHLSFQQTPHLLILLSGQICFPFIPVNPIPKQAYNIIPGADLANPSNAIYEEIMT